MEKSRLQSGMIIKSCKKDMEQIMEKTISIVIPVYNGENYIRKTILQILQSTYEKLELVIVNDGSVDRSLEICQALQKTDDRIKIYTKVNGGVVSARNYGVSKANGVYLCFCDQDDIVDAKMYGKMVERIERDESDICMCSTGRNIDGRVSAFELSDDALYEGDEVLKYLLLPLIFNGYAVPVEMSRRNLYPHIWNCMFSMKFWEKYNFQFRAYVNFEDDLLMKIDTLSRADKVSTISYVGYYWRVNLKSETYAHKFVENIAEKQRQCYMDMNHCLQRRVKDAATLDLFTRVTRCNQYLIAVHNLTSPMCRKNISFVRQYYQKLIYNCNFSVNIEARRYLKKGRIKPMILLPLLAGKFTLLSYLMEILLDYILLFSLHSQILTKIERKLKGEKG